jgi:hypothetical protein
MAVGGTLDETFVEKELKRRGISPEAVRQFKRAIRFMAESQDIKDCQTIIRSLVKEGFMSKDQARATFQAFKTLDDPLERQLFIADLYYLYDLRVDQRDDILTRYKAGKIPQETARDRLIQELRMVPDKVEVLLSRALAAVKLKAETATV